MRDAAPAAGRSRPTRPPVRMAREDTVSARPDAPEVTVWSDGLTIHMRSASAPGWRVAAYAFGIPWLAWITLASFAYLIWGTPEEFFVRLMLWVVLMLLTAALHALAGITLWGMAYARSGTETLMVDPRRITLRRQAGRFPIEVHILRNILESATPLPARYDGQAHPRIEVRAWRSAVRFGAGLTEDQVEECLDVLNTFFEGEERLCQRQMGSTDDPAERTDR